MLRTLAINSNQIVLSFGVLIAFWSPKQYEIEESYLESMAKQWKAQIHEEPSFGAPYPFAKVVQSVQGKNNGERKNRVKKTEDGSCSLLLNFWSTSRSPFSTCYISFQSSRSQESNALNGAWFWVETKELQPLKADHSKLKEDFYTAAKSAFCCENFAAILHSARVFSWSFLIVATDSFRSFLQIFLYKSPFSPCNPPTIRFLSY